MRSVLMFLALLLVYPAVLLSQDFNQVDDRNMKQGKWQKTYLSGQVKYEGQFRNDKPYGEFNYYYENGELQAHTRFSPDGIIAYTKLYHPNGLPMADGKYVRQLRDSTWNFYSEVDGKRVASEDYLNGKLHGRSILYYPETGREMEITEYEQGVRNGQYLKYFPGGEVMTRGFYKDDQLHDDFTVYFEDGSIQIKGRYNNGLKEGNWLYYNESGEPLTEDQYKGETEIKNTDNK